MPAEWPVLAFCHVPKTGGTSVNDLLRRNLGLRHLDVMPCAGYVYGREDLARDLRRFPWIRSIAGHCLRPFVDYGEPGGRLRWFTMLREPVARTVSHYQHEVVLSGQERSLEEWLELPYNRNWHVRMLAGGQDLDRALEVLAERDVTVGLLSDFDRSVRLMAARSGLARFDPACLRRRNVSGSNEVRDRIRANMDRYRPVLEEANALDLELHRRVSEELYPALLAEVGLDTGPPTEHAEPRSPLTTGLNSTLSFLLRNALYRPLMQLRGRSTRLN